MLPMVSNRLTGLTVMAAALVVGFFTYLCLRDGAVPNRGFVFERAKRPILYWLFIAFYMALALGLAVFGVSLISVSDEAHV
jgi:membrane associated rhomboid family serine protease